MEIKKQSQLHFLRYFSLKKKNKKSQGKIIKKTKGLWEKERLTFKMALKKGNGLGVLLNSLIIQF